MAGKKRGRRGYATDLTDGQWALIAPLIPEAEPGGRPRKAAARELVNAILYFLRAGMAWRLLPHDFPPGRRSTTTCAAGSARASGSGCIMRWSWPTANAPGARPARARRSSTASR
jgi:transposase